MKIHAISDICDSNIFYDVGKLYLGNQDSIFEINWLDEIIPVLEQPSHKFQMIIRSSCLSDYIQQFLMGVLGRLYNFQVTVLTSGIRLKERQKTDFYGYLIELQLLKYQLWSMDLVKYLVYYTANILYLLDVACCPFNNQIRLQRQTNEEMLPSYIGGLIRYGCDYAFLPERFIHNKMAKLLCFYASRNRGKKGRDAKNNPLKYMPNFLRRDLRNISMVLNRRHAVMEALANVNEFNNTLITTELLAQFDVIQREF